MTFASHQYAYLLFVLPVIALLKIWADTRTHRAMAAFASSERIRTSLLGGASLVWSGIIFGLQLLGLGFFLIALTRPQFGDEDRYKEQTTRNVLIAMDTSKSMLTKDLMPNRLSRAKLAAQDLLEKLKDDRVGLIAFAGRSFLQAPLTTDHQAVAEAIQFLDHTTIPRGGSSLAAAIQMANSAMENSGSKKGALIIFTDGQETDDATLAAAREAATKNLVILAVGVGTPVGDLVPEADPASPGEYVRGPDGRPVRSKLEEPLLKQLASITNGEYIPLASQTLTYSLVNRLLIKLDERESTTKQDSRKIERYQWPLGCGILCIMTSLLMRSASRKLKKGAALPVDPKATVHSRSPMPARAASMLILLGALTLESPLLARSETPTSEAEEAYTKGEFEKAREVYKRLLNEKKAPAPREKLSYGMGASDFQLKFYGTAVESFSGALQSQDPAIQLKALRGLGTSLYNQGDEVVARTPEAAISFWKNSLAHFNSALNLAPHDEEIRANRDFVKKRLEVEEKKQEQQKQQRQQQQQSQGAGSGSPGTPQEGAGAGQEEQNQPGKSGELDEKKKDIAEGEIKAAESGEGDPEQPQQDPNDKRNGQTGYSVNEALNQLRNYADEKSVQYLMRTEEPHNGKDY